MFRYASQATQKKVQTVWEKIQKEWNSKTNICPNILHEDPDTDTDMDPNEGGIAIALLHSTAITL